MHEQLILETAEAAAPALKALAAEILASTARGMGVSLDVGDVLLRRAEGTPAGTSPQRPTSCSST